MYLFEHRYMLGKVEHESATSKVVHAKDISKTKEGGGEPPLNVRQSPSSFDALVRVLVLSFRVLWAWLSTRFECSTMFKVPHPVLYCTPCRHSMVIFFIL